MFGLLLVLFLEPLGFTHGGAKVLGQSLGGNARSGKLLTERAHFVAGRGEGGFGLFSGGALSAPGADVFCWALSSLRRSRAS
ncbi:hypothetical protein MZE46_029315 [Pseudomonas sp. A4]|uniref:hypothetical protein n=1 Tax=Pseudomonas sp. S11A4 TaxID=1476791 RepID=UPI00215CDF94|nr:hypothetical protein [Pseudomonas sp. S11A4]MCR8935686.1 hypothetical protein [Pseudomonas sp. S11A4]